MALTDIIVHPLWTRNVSTVTPNRNIKRSETSCRTEKTTIRLSDFHRLRNLGILQKKKRSFLIAFLQEKGLNNFG